jgi:hypothetical protein
MSAARKIRRGIGVAKLELPSGGWVEYRDRLMAGDKFAVQDAVSMEFNDNGGRKASLGLLNDQRNALLGRIITGWSFGQTPDSVKELMAADVVIGNALDIDDYNALADEVQPLLDKVMGTKVPKTPSAS